ncbi:MAG: hypothetical protein DRQ55_04210 [Planctomycetota bacterium]|nr:MAG: hypothetical protein DRQ55_04210 [Planctomycetota bacterium]
MAQEALTSSQGGINRLASVATFGFPLAQADGVYVDPGSGRPALAVEGSNRWQFSSLDQWPDGSAKWVLVDLLTDVAAGQQTPLLITNGSGVSDGAALATLGSDTVEIDTGPLQVTLSRDDFDLFEHVTVDQQPLVRPSTEPGLYATTMSGELLLPGDDTQVTLERNGPACSIVVAEGKLVDATDSAQAWFSCRLIFRAGSRDVETTLTLRNASQFKNEHLQLGSFELAVKLDTGTDTAVTTTTRTGQPHFSQALAAGEECVYYMGQTSASVTDLGSSQYRPHIPKQSGSATQLVDQGYELSVGGAVVHALGNKYDYANKPWLDLTGAAGGVTIAIQRLSQMWPGSLEADGDGLVTLGAFSSRNDAGFTWLWQQHESRAAIFSFHRDQSGSPDTAAIILDHPLSGRVSDYLHYDAAGVFPYRLVTEAQTQQVFAALGISQNISPGNITPAVRRYLYSHESGGPNNYPRIETHLASHWLRFGAGGYYLSALDQALYKSEWQIRRSDDFVDANASAYAASNAYLPTTHGTFGDDEHRYREGIILAYHLTGDPRFRDAIYDEAELLRGVYVWAHERSMYKTLVAMAHVIEFTGDTDLRDSRLIPRLEYITQPSGLNVCAASSGYGWEGTPLNPAQFAALTPGVDRRYYAYSGDLHAEKAPGEHFQARGFITASFGPVGYYHAARALDPLDPLQRPMHDAARARMRDLAWWTREDLFFQMTPPNGPYDYRMVYSYGVCGQYIKSIDAYDYHPILLGMAETYRDLKDVDLPMALEFLDTGALQLRAAKLHDQLGWLVQRLECQHFFATWLEQYGS